MTNYKTMQNGQVFDQGQRVYSPNNNPTWAAVSDKPAVVVMWSENAGFTLTSELALKSTTPLTFPTYGGSIYMQDITWVRIGGNKSLYVANAGNESIKTAGGVWAGQNVTAYSDIRLKTDIRPIFNATEMVRKMRGYTYLRKDLTDGVREYGVIAQEIQKVMPEIVKREGDSDMLGVRYHGIIPVLLEAIKELDLRLVALENK
ncbi:tail fiber domain-containing protein [Photobacterium ganghwense]|uniref:tail fiber domain-containing protein n=1 Tax=Photobacterium ganghwense TaxID=320778 RepID=UPI001A8EE258|nr:tail fiber domain-containing protein [Photobacterium ganghwense]QSV17201.1 tail fiber domain-containing protein [Photobacterium ganghwense]